MNFIKRMNSVLDYIEDNLDGEISDDKIAILSANSKGMFQRIFTMITDMTLSEYIRKRRLTQACADIQNTDEKIIDIAIKYGYNSPDAFTTAFKNFHGITPSAAKIYSIDIQSFRRFTFNPNLTITGGNNNMQYRTISLDETIYFWLRSDYHIIGDILRGKMSNLWKSAEICNENAKWMLNAFEEGKITLDEREIVRCKNRIYDKLDDEAKANVMKIAKIDIANLLGAMKPAKKEMLLYRTIYGDVIYNNYPHYNIDDIVEFKHISSTAAAPYMENKFDDDAPYAEELNANIDRYEFYRFEITVPENGFILELDDYEEYSKDWWEKGEVLLPPMKCVVKNIRESENVKCKGIIEFEYLERLPNPV
jgi:AraC-type DNA-binding domain-containing proteins